MANDPILDGILADIADAMPEAGDAVTLVSAGESCTALFDDGELDVRDSLGEMAPVMETVVRYRDGAITRPVAGTTITIQYRAEKEEDDATYQVRKAHKDPGNPGMIRVVLSPT